MRELRNRILAFVAIAVMTGACLSIGLAETPEQRWFAAKSEYAIVLDAAVVYADSPVAHPKVVAVLAGIDRQAQSVMRQGDAILAKPDHPDRAIALEDCARMLELFRAALRSQLIDARGTP
jgi:hypothetical protein